ncbi:hypothetical protein J132_10431 [Termitomyces sp. J132]|nr:hypothetical protein H2248_006750 [Termitomyces sp. 'cryptogamus']KNZ76456.1 hypothetical protein J132_10431 [Termitomyces sp. J132]
MTLQPSLRPLVVAGSLEAPHTLDIFLDYVCPFSSKMALIIDGVLKPLFESGGKYAGKVKAIIRLQVQPWHATSTLTHESALAVARASPEHFWPYSLLLFKNQGDYFDIPASTLTPLQVRENLAKLAAQVIPPAAVEEFKELLRLKSTPNGGNAVTDDLKYTIKFSRQNSIHVSPTVLWDGLVANEISSSWGTKEWSEFLAAKVKV